MIKCCIFSRVSSLHQSADEQTKELLNEAHRQGYEDNEITTIEWTESAIKLNLSERESIQSLYKIIDDHPIECVICRELSRIARRPDVLYQVRDTLVQRRIQLIVCNPYMMLLDKDGKLSQTANIMFSLFSSIAESEMAIKKERFHEGKLRKKNQGKWAGGWLPYGYKYDEKTHDIYADEEQAAIVRKIFDMYINKNMSTVEIARYFNETGEMYTCRDESCLETAVCTISGMLKNVAYIGQKPTDKRTKKVVDNIYPRIVSDEMFKAAADKLWLRNTRKNPGVPKTTSKHTYFCKDMLFDTKGNKLVGKSVANSYRFVRHGFNGNEQITVPINMVDSLVWHYTKKFSQNHPLTSVADKMAELKSEFNINVRKIKNAKTKIAELEEQIVRINQRIVSGKLRESVGDAMLEKVEKNIDELNESIIMWSFDCENKRQAMIALEGKHNVDLNDITEDEEMAEIIKEFMTKAVVEMLAWGKYKLSIYFVDGTVEECAFKSMSKVAWEFSDPEEKHIDFDYLERFVRPTSSKD